MPEIAAYWFTHSMKSQASLIPTVLSSDKKKLCSNSRFSCEKQPFFFFSFLFFDFVLFFFLFFNRIQRVLSAGNHFCLICCHTIIEKVKSIGKGMKRMNLDHFKKFGYRQILWQICYCQMNNYSVHYQICAFFSTKLRKINHQDKIQKSFFEFYPHNKAWQAQPSHEQSVEICRLSVDRPASTRAEFVTFNIGDSIANCIYLRTILNKICTDIVLANDY